MDGCVGNAVWLRDVCFMEDKDHLFVYVNIFTFYQSLKETTKLADSYKIVTQRQIWYIVYAPNLCH